MKYLFLFLIAFLLFSPIEASKNHGCRCPCKCVTREQAWKQCEKKFRIHRGCVVTSPRFCKRSKQRRKQGKIHSCCCMRVRPTKPMTTTTTTTTTPTTTTSTTTTSTTTTTTPTTTTKKSCPRDCYAKFKDAKKACYGLRDHCEVDECHYSDDNGAVTRSSVRDVLYNGFKCGDRVDYNGED